MESVVIDQIDSDILRELQRNGRATQRELGKAVGLSPNAAAARMTRLQQAGVITGYTVAVDHTKLGRPIEASIDVWLRDEVGNDRLAAVAVDDERIIEAFHPTGPVDYRLRVRVSSTDDLAALIDRLRAEADVRQTDTRLVLVRLTTDG